MMRSRVVLGAFWVAACLGAVPSVASAHVRAPEREVIAQLDDEGLALLVRVAVYGRRAELLRGVHDRDGNGILSAGEQQQIAFAVLAKGMAGVRLRWNGERLVLSSADSRALQEPGGGLVVESLLTAVVEKPRESTEQKLLVHIDEHRGPLRISMRSLPPWRALDTALHTLAPGGSLELRWVRGSGSQSHE